MSFSRTKIALSAFALAAAATFGQSVRPAQAEEVYMLRGFLNVFSTGMNQMAGRLRAKGVNATAISAGSWPPIATDIIRRSKEKKVSYPIIIAGHSLGGVEAVNFANTLGRAGVPVSLVIGLDPGFRQPNSFHQGIKKVINYKMPNGRAYRRGSGFKGSISNVDVSKYGTGHVSIDKNHGVQSLVIRQVMARVKK